MKQVDFTNLKRKLERIWENTESVSVNLQG